MTERYVKRTQKGKGRKIKQARKELKQLIDDIRPQIKPVFSMALSLMIKHDLEKKEKENKDV